MPSCSIREGLLRVLASRGCCNQLAPDWLKQHTHLSSHGSTGWKSKTRLMGLKIEILPAGSRRAPFSLPFLGVGGHLHPLAHGCSLIPPNSCFRVTSHLPLSYVDVSEVQDQLWGVNLL